MRSLSSTLTTAQQAERGEPLCKLVFSSGATRYGWSLRDRLVRLKRTEKDGSHSADVVLDDYDQVVSAISLKGYLVNIARGYRTGIARSAWLPSTVYAVDDIVTPTTPNGYQYRCVVAGTTGAPTIDVGSSAINRSGSFPSGFTLIDTANPANTSGILDKVEIWAATNITGFKLATFVSAGGGDYTCRDSVSIGSITAGSKQTFTGFSLQVQSGDFIGCYFATGSLEQDTTGAVDIYYTDAGDFTAPSTTTNFPWVDTPANAVSIFAYYVTDPTWPTTLGVTVVDGGVTWEMDGKTGDEYSSVAPMVVKDQQDYSSPGVTANYLALFGIPDQLKLNVALANLAPDAANTDTVKTWIQKVFGSGATQLACFSHCPAITVDFDSEDSLIDVYQPKDTMRIYEGESQLSQLDKLLSWTKCVSRFRADGHIHILSPIVSGVSYDFSFNDLKGYHTFFNKVYRDRLVLPNKIIIHTADGVTPAYTGNYTDSVSYALLPKEDSEVMTLASDAQATAIATAKIQKLQQEAEKGSGTAPLNVGQELFDYIDVVDSVAGDERAGNIGYLSELIDKDGKFEQSFGFGAMLLGGLIGSGGAAMAGGTFTYDQVASLISDIYDNLNSMADSINNAFGLGFRIESLTLDDVADTSSYKRTPFADYLGDHILLSSTIKDANNRTVTDTEKAVYVGKAKVYRQTTAPAGTDYNEGDIWINTTSNYDLPYTWKVGTGWIAAYTYIDAGYLKTGTIDASVLTIQTAGSGSRVVIDTDGIRIIGSKLVLADSANFNAHIIYITTGEELILNDWGTSVLADVRPDTAGVGDGTTGRDMGSGTYPWERAYVYSLTVNALSPVGSNIGLGATIDPAINETYNIGTTTHALNNVYSTYFKTKGGQFIVYDNTPTAITWMDTMLYLFSSVDSIAVTDLVTIGGYDISAGHRALAIGSEETVVNSAAGASDKYLPIRVNGATYKLLLHS